MAKRRGRVKAGVDARAAPRDKRANQEEPMSKRISPTDIARFRPRTRDVLAGRDPADNFGFVNPPIVRGSTVLYDTLDDLANRRARFPYGTKGNPTIQALERALQDLEGSAGVVLAPSGLFACALPLLAFLSAGDHLLVTDSVYQPTRNICDQLMKRMGVETTYYDPLIGEGIAALIRPNTKAIFTESPGSQTFEIQDIPAIVKAAHARDVLVMIDNTWATPLYFDAIGHGVDVVIQAGTKYFAGHSDVLIGSVSTRTAEQFKTLRTAFDLMAAVVSPEDAFLTLRGLRTMRVKLAEQEKAGLAMARWFAEQPQVSRVLHPALPGCPGHDLWKRDFTGASSLFSIVLKPGTRERLAAMVDGLELFGMGASWGGYESLALPFDCKAYRTATKWEAEGPTIRIHIGLEDVEDLKAEMAAALARYAG